MESKEDILELRFLGNGIRPGSVKPHEIAALVVSLEKALLSEIKERHPLYDTEQLFFAFEELKDQSIGVLFVPKLVKDVVITIFATISNSFHTGDFSELTNKTIKELK